MKKEITPQEFKARLQGYIETKMRDIIPKIWAEIDKQIDDAIEQGIITPDDSGANRIKWAANIVQETRKYVENLLMGGKKDEKKP